MFFADKMAIFLCLSDSIMSIKIYFVALAFIAFACDRT